MLTKKWLHMNKGSLKKPTTKYNCFLILCQYLN
jgi:hypothetical protein